jgi:ABC-type polysaccharide/polyol phosphate export permease
MLVSMVGVGCDSFVAGAATMKSGPMPLSALVLRGAAGPVIQFGHDFLVIVIVLIACRVPVTWTLVLVPAVLTVLVINGIAVGFWLGRSGRFRAMSSPSSKRSTVRPSSSRLSSTWRATSRVSSKRRSMPGTRTPTCCRRCRDPLLGYPLAPAVYIGTAVITVANVTAGLLVFARARSKIPYWVA